MIRLFFALLAMLPSIAVASCELDQLPRAEPSMQEKILYAALPETMTQMPPSPLWAKGKAIARTALRMKDQDPTPEQLSQCRENIVKAEKLFRFNHEESFFDPRWPIVLLVAVEHGMYEFARDAWLSQLIVVRYEEEYFPDAWDTRAKKSFMRLSGMSADVHSDAGLRRLLINMVRSLDVYDV